MRFGISLPNFGHMAQVDGIIEIARKAEEFGYSSLWAAERLIVPIPPNQSWSRRDPTAFEPVVTLSYIAGMTERIHLGTSIVILPIRNPVLLARAAASLDVLSGGRFELGVGVGWMREEMRASNVVFCQRGKIMDEYITMMREVWHGNGYHGKFVSVPSNLFEPKPVRGTIPIWVGGNSDAALRRVARLGDGWVPMGSIEPDELRVKVDRILEMAADYGRKGDICISCNHYFTPESLGDTKACLNTIESYSSAGATQLIPRFECETAGEMVELMETFAREVLPSFK